MSSRTPQTVAVLLGGPSAEREVSLSSGKECATALRVAGFDVVEIDAGVDLVEQLKSAKPDVAFNALHGRWCEDGVVQGVLEWLRIPYTHSGVLASATSMDKQKTKDVYRTHGLPFVKSVLATKAQIEAGHVMTPPYVVKPFDEGSSVGIYLVMEGDTPPTLADGLPDLMMVETYAPGRELTTAVMGDRALTVTDIVVDGWYDYEAKYGDGGSKHILPADIPKEIFDACIDYAVRAHDALGCRGLSRSDYRWDESRGLDGLILLETNTQPGMTPTSLAPEQAAHVGISFPELMTWMVEDASCDR
ncbi:D-alanine-D-alanine ligase [Octadecabacter temperatus]|uniref:D-alanine--D-alanine ligase n=1 Tax=Octadecabacter temperatus TaxID=1458307 RepID=A0A0K0Y407_9RHOB|nr:D-alanine--D-alanine ligase [Octadecabacter temperatus]AKS45665.1 D-alanine--D-alanine ligase B [Octadecabacter temperatus]SIN97900.1 D-alanine-D-alanine ligase [Octadecabacter temperatus]